ncbi:MAG: hypothetical protein KDE32_05515 [Novosphingobium sp.]|nr:hypothetical protein [Novosphingobium sp.]
MLRLDPSYLLEMLALEKAVEHPEGAIERIEPDGVFGRQEGNGLHTRECLARVDVADPYRRVVFGKSLADMIVRLCPINVRYVLSFDGGQMHCHVRQDKFLFNYEFHFTAAAFSPVSGLCRTISPT